MMHTLVVHYYEPEDDGDKAGMLITDPEITNSPIKIINGFIGGEATKIYNTLRYGTQKVTIMEKGEYEASISEANKLCEKDC